MIDFQLDVSLVPVEDSEHLRAWRNDPKIWRWTRQNDLISEAQQKAWFEKQAKDPSMRMYSIVQDEIRIVGVCGLTSIDRLNRNAEFSLYIAPEYQKQKIAEKALLTLFYHGFKNMGLHLIWGETFENNHAQSLFAKIGMVQDGRRREFYWKDGKFWDAILFSVKSDEFLLKHGDRSCFT